MSLLRWASKSTRMIAEELARRGHWIRTGLHVKAVVENLSQRHQELKRPTTSCCLALQERRKRGDLVHQHGLDLEIIALLHRCGEGLQ